MRKTLGRDKDDRYLLTEETERELQNDIDNGTLTRKELAAKYKVSPSKIWQMCNPLQHARNYKARKKFQKGGKYYNKEKHQEAQVRYREKLKGLSLD